MNKKFLSAILFGALMVTSTGTFVSCKDYDDDIENLQGQISANSSAIAELKALIGDGNYVTSISVSGQNLVVNTKNGSTNVPLPKCEDKVGSMCTISEEGELLIDGKATGIKVAEQAEDAEFKPAIDIVDGEWAVLQEDNTYKSTGVEVSSVAVTGDKQNGYVLTVKDAEGNATVVELPTAASLITSIDVVPASTGLPTLMIKKAQFNTDAWANAWGGKREVPADNSMVYGVSSLDVRIDPVSAPAQDVDFYLTNTKNHTLSNLKLYAAATQDSNAGAMNSGNINGRAAVTGNGLWTLKMDQFVLSEDDAEDFQEDLDDNTGTIVYAVNANKVARSKYNVIVDEEDAAALTKVKVVNMANSDATVAPTATAATATAIEVNVGQTYKIDEIADEDGLMWDMFFNAASATAVETYGLVFDHLNRTFTVTKRPDVVTTPTAFTLNVYTLDILGNRKVAKYDVSLSAKIDAATATYPAVTHNLKSIATTNDGSDDYFTLPISTMKTALGDKWTTWANSVDLTQTVVTVHKKANLSDTGVEVDRHIDGTPAASQATEGLGYYLLTSAPSYTEDVNNLNNIRINVSAASTPTYTVDTQYYVKVTFNNASGAYINHVVVPVTFVAPTVADQFALKAGYVVEGTVNAFYYDYESAALADRKSVGVAHYFDAYDALATISLDGDAAVVTKNNGEPYASNHLATLTATDVATAKLSLKATATGAWGGTIAQDANTKTEAGYGKELTIEAWNETYNGWKYENNAQKAYSFKIKLMSPIFEGTIKPVSGSTINVTANAETGFAITKSMIELADYNKNLYSVVPDKANATPDNTGTDGVDAWVAAQINDVWATKDANNTYIKELAMRAHLVNTEGTVTQEGAIIVKADPLPNTQATSMTVNVKDCWGYLKAQEVSVTIVKQ